MFSYISYFISDVCIADFGVLANMSIYKISCKTFKNEMFLKDF